jgi:stage III sporulation protein AH
MKKVWRRNLVVLTVIVFVGAAAYLNYNYGSEAAGAAQKILGQSELVSGESDTDAVEASSGTSSDTAKTDGGDKDAGDYFSTARLTRQEARDKAKALLEEAAGEKGATQDVLDKASAGIKTLADQTVREASIENLVKAKGYSDCVAFLNDGSISVVVAAGEGGLSSTDVVKITDIVLEETGFTADQIKIMEAN